MSLLGFYLTIIQWFLLVYVCIELCWFMGSFEFLKIDIDSLLLLNALLFGLSLFLSFINAIREDYSLSYKFLYEYALHQKSIRLRLKDNQDVLYKGKLFTIIKIEEEDENHYATAIIFNKYTNETKEVLIYELNPITSKKKRNNTIKINYKPKNN